MRLKNNRGDASFKVMIVSLAIFMTLLAALYSRLEIRKIRMEAGMGNERDSGNIIQQVQETVSERTFFDADKKSDDKAARTDATTTLVNQAGGQMNSDSLFYYGKLSAEEQKVYCQIYEAVVNRTEKTLTTLDEDLADRLFQLVLCDHPEIFYTRGYQMVKHTVNGIVNEISFKAVYEMTPDQQSANQSQIDQYVNAFLDSVPVGLDTYGKIKYVYDYIINHTDYQLNSLNSQNICSVMIGRRSVCAGYAKATQYLLSKLSIPSIIVQGKVGNEGHAWNMVFVDGNPYYLDTTWGDASYSFRDNEQGQNRKPPEVNYDYFLITEQELKLTHTMDHPEYYPPAIATQDNYYRREGKYFESYDTRRLADCIQDAYAQDKSTVTIRMANDTLMDEMVKKLIDDQEIFRYLNGNDSLSYSVNEGMRTLTFWL